MYQCHTCNLFGDFRLQFKKFKKKNKKFRKRAPRVITPKWPINFFFLLTNVWRVNNFSIFIQEYVQRFPCPSVDPLCSNDTRSAIIPSPTVCNCCDHCFLFQGNLLFIFSFLITVVKFCCRLNVAETRFNVSSCFRLLIVNLDDRIISKKKKKC